MQHLPQASACVTVVQEPPRHLPRRITHERPLQLAELPFLRCLGEQPRERAVFVFGSQGARPGELREAGGHRVCVERLDRAGWHVLCERPREPRRERVRGGAQGPGGEQPSAQHRAAREARREVTARPERPGPSQAVDQRDAAAEALPQPPPHLVRRVRQAQVLRACQEGAHQAPADQTAALGGDHQLGGDSRPDRLPLEPQRARNDAEKACHPTALVLVHERRQFLVGPGMAEENLLQVVRQPIWGVALAETKHLLAQRDDVGQVLAEQRPQAPRPRLYCAVGDRASGQASWRGRTLAPEPLAWHF